MLPKCSLEVCINLPYFLPLTVYESAILQHSEITKYYSLTTHLPVGQVGWHTGILSPSPPVPIPQITYRDTENQNESR